MLNQNFQRRLLLLTKVSKRMVLKELIEIRIGIKMESLNLRIMVVNIRKTEIKTIGMIIEVRIKMIISIKKEKGKEIGSLMIKGMKKLKGKMIGLISRRGLKE